MRTVYHHKISDLKAFKNQLLHWAQEFDEIVYLDSNAHNGMYSKYDLVLAVDAFTSIKTDHTNAFEDLKQYQSTTKDWLFGYLSYDLKNDIEDLTSEHPDGLEFPELYFFQPKKLFFLNGDELEAHYLNAVADEYEDDLSAICKHREVIKKTTSKNVKIKLRIHKDDYFKKVNALLDHIHRGDVYEANFCQEFYSEQTQINPVEIYTNLNAISRPPFALFLKQGHHYALSASPERYLKKQGTKVISQPIKGTASRALNKEEDRRLKEELSQDPKERSENIMIVDLVRNDLSHTAIKGSVKVDELCKIYTFDQVHQMISTISSEVTAETHPVAIIRSTFPMGSMTGAPKISAMKIIEQLEETKRGLYSGAVGYFTPEGDFDFNVVIRSILYNASEHYVSYSVGSAITAKSNPLKEYEECLIKAKAMRQVLEA